MDRLVVTARLRPGEAARARELIVEGPPFDPDDVGFERHGVYLAGDVVIFVFEGGGVEWLVEQVVDDPVVAASFGAWGPLLESRPSVAREVWHWARSDPRAGV